MAGDRVPQVNRVLSSPVTPRDKAGGRYFCFSNGANGNPQTARVSSDAHRKTIMRPIILVALFSTAAAAASQNVYFGNLHSHTSYSDGRGTPDEAFASARAAGLDFFAITEHNHAAADGKGDARDGIVIATRPEFYAGRANSLRESALRQTENGRFVALFGQEFSTISVGNHVNVFEVPNVIGVANGDFGRLASWVREARDSSSGTPLVQFNHPRNESRFLKDYGRDDFPDERAWVAALDPHVQLIEVLNAPALKDGQGFRAHDSQADYFRYLNLGFHVSPSVGHDNHYRNWGTSTDARVAVVAASLDRASVLQALKQRHTYATEDKNLRIVFRMNGALAGDIIPPPPPGAELKLTITLSDDDEPGAAYRVDVFKDQPGGKAASTPTESYEFRGNVTTPAVLEGIRYAAPGEFVLVRVTQFSTDEHGEDDRAWTAPVWLEPGTAATPASIGPKLRISRLIPNPPGDDEVNEEVAIRNLGTTSVTFAGWRLRDLADNLWSLDGAGPLAAGQQVILRRNRQPLSLNNGGDRIELIDSEGAVVDSVDYGPVSEGQVINPQQP